jgi:hypothetical protein
MIGHKSLVGESIVLPFKSPSGSFIPELLCFRIGVRVEKRGLPTTDIGAISRAKESGKTPAPELQEHC